MSNISDEEKVLNIFASQNTQSSISHIKECYRKFYGFTKNQNDARLYPKKDTIKDSSGMYDVFQNIIYNTGSKLNYTATQNPEYFKSNILFTDDFNPEVPINKDATILNSYRLTNLIQPFMVTVSNPYDTNKKLSYVMNDNVYLSNPQIQQNEMDERGLEYIGNNYCSPLYLQCMNPIFGDIKESNKLEHYKVFELLRDQISSNGGDLDSISDCKSYNEYGFFYIVRNIIKKMISSNDVLKGIDVDKDVFDLIRDKKLSTTEYTELMSILDLVYTGYMKVAPYILSPLYSLYLSSPMANIFFMALSILCIKKLYKLSNTECAMKDQALYCLNSIIDNSILYIEYLDKTKNVEDASKLFDDIGPAFTSSILGSDVETILKSLTSLYSEINCTHIGKDSTKIKNINTVYDSAISISSLIELFYKFEDVAYFDFALFEVNVDSSNKEVLSMFSDSLLEASLIYKNSIMCESIVDISTPMDNKVDFYSYNGKSTLRKMDTTCTIYKEAKYDRDINIGMERSDFAAINCMISLASSIRICIDNFTSKNDILLLNSQMKRSSSTIDIWKEYIREYLYMTKAYLTDSISHMDEVNNDREALIFLGGMDYGFQIKTWVYDSYYFWRSYKKFTTVTGIKDREKCLGLYKKYNDLQCSFLSEMEVTNIVDHVRGMVTIPLAGIYSYSAILGSLKRYTPNSYDYILSAYSRILMKDLYMFGDQETIKFEEYRNAKFSEDHWEYPFVIRDKIFQQCLNLFTSNDYERIIASTYVNWYKWDILPLMEADQSLKTFINETIPSMDYTEVSIDSYILPGMFNQLFAYECMWSILTDARTQNVINLFIHIVMSIKYLSVNISIKNNLAKFNNYKFNDDNNDVDGSIFGLLLYNRYQKSDSYNFNKRCNILLVMCKDRFKTSIDDVYRDCVGLPIYLFYKNGISILIENIYMLENESVVRAYHMPLPDTCIDFTNLTTSEIKMIDTGIRNSIGYEKFNQLSYNKKLEIIKEYDEVSNPYTNEEINIISSYIQEINSEIEYLNFSCHLSNFEFYCKAIVLANLLGWDREQYSKYIVTNIYRFNMLVSVRNKIINSKNVTNIKIIDKIQNDENQEKEKKLDIAPNDPIVITQQDVTYINDVKYRTKALDKPTIYHPKWVDDRICKLEEKCVDCKYPKQKEAMKNLIKYLGSQDCRFIFETIPHPSLQQ